MSGDGTTLPPFRRRARKRRRRAPLVVVPWGVALGGRPQGNKLRDLRLSFPFLTLNLRVAYNSWCPVPGGSGLILPTCAWLISEVRSHQDQRQQAKVKSEGKRTSSSSAGPGGRQEKKERTVECVWSMSSLLGVLYNLCNCCVRSHCVTTCVTIAAGNPCTSRPPLLVTVRGFAYQLFSQAS